MYQKQCQKDTGSPAPDPTALQYILTQTVGLSPFIQIRKIFKSLLRHPILICAMCSRVSSKRGKLMWIWDLNASHRPNAGMGNAPHHPNADTGTHACLIEGWWEFKANAGSSAVLRGEVGLGKSLTDPLLLTTPKWVDPPFELNNWTRMSSVKWVPQSLFSFSYMLKTGFNTQSLLHKWV